MNRKIVVAGHICLDITPAFPDREATNLGDVLTPGQLLQVGNADVHIGGTVANTGLALKNLLQLFCRQLLQDILMPSACS